MGPPHESTVDVLIIGAGPAGSFLSFALGRAGVHVRIVDKREVRIPAGHADGIQPRMIEVLQSYGLAERFLADATQIHIKAYYNTNPNGGGIVRTRLEPTSMHSRYPFEASLAQSGIEGLLRDAMRESGIIVQQPTIPISIHLSDDESELQSMDSYPIRVVLNGLKFGADPASGDLSGDNATETVRAKFVIGADGAHSWVRKTMGIEMIGESTNFVWGVVDFLPETDFPDIRLTCAIHADRGSCMIIPREGDLIRLYVYLGESEAEESTGRVDRSKFSLEDILEVAQGAFHPYKLEFRGTEWWTVYSIAQRIASTYSVKNRVFIAGDACHTHSPKAGQGMNAAMNDAHNLAWKLVYVLRRWSASSLLDTYEFERRKFAQDLIDFDKVFATLYSTKPKSEDHTYEAFVQACQAYDGIVSGHAVRYEASTIVDTSRNELVKNIPIGQRMPPGTVLRLQDFRPYDMQDLVPSDTRFKILVFCGNTSKQEQKQKLDALAAHLQQPRSFFKRFLPPGPPSDAIFDILTISRITCEDANIFSIPARFRSRWTKAFVDGQSLCGRYNGEYYSTYGISDRGAVVVCRPDGYIGMIAGLDDTNALESYFSGFLRWYDV